MRIDVTIVDTVPVGSILPTISSAPAVMLGRPEQRRPAPRTAAPMADRKPKSPAASAKSKRATPPGAQARDAAARLLSGRARRQLAPRLPRGVPDLEPVACATFEDALAAVKSGDARYAMIPIENSVAGRVADIHHLLPNAGLHIVGEHFLRVRHQLMALPGASLLTVKKALSHTQALGQCRNTLRKLGLTADARGRHGRLRAHRRRGQRPRARGDRHHARGRDLRPQDPHARHRGREAQHHALRHPRRRARRRQGRRRADRHHLHLPRAQRAGRALQGDGRLRHQRRQHDQARELSARRPLRRHHVLSPTSRATPTTRR